MKQKASDLITTAVETYGPHMGNKWATYGEHMGHIWGPGLQHMGLFSTYGEEMLPGAQHMGNLWVIFSNICVVFLLCWLRTELNLRWVRDRSSFYSFQRERLDTHIQENGGMPV